MLQALLYHNMLLCGSTILSIKAQLSSSDATALHDSPSLSVCSISLLCFGYFSYHHRWQNQYKGCDFYVPFTFLEFPWLLVLSFHSLWPSEAIWWHRTRSTLAQVMACCLVATSHCLNQSWLIISEVLWHLPEGKFTGNAYRPISQGPINSAKFIPFMLISIPIYIYISIPIYI